MSAAPITIRMILTGPYRGETKLLNGHQFIKGVAAFTGSDTQVEGVSKYFTRSYGVEIIIGLLRTEAEPVIEEPDNEATRVDDSDVISDDQIDEQDEKKSDYPLPNPRQIDIITAVNGIEKTEWVDLNAKTPRPRVKDVSILMEDPTVTKAEIIEVIETWLS